MSNYIKVNDTKFEYVFFDNMIQNNQYFRLNTTDVNAVKAAFKDIDTVELYNDDTPTGVYTEWGTYSRIWIEDNADSFYTCVALKPADYKAQIKKLDNQLNPKYNLDEMMTDELQDYVKKTTSEKCRETIYNGTDVETSYGTEHLTFNADDQRNLKELCDIALQTQIDIPYHKNGYENQCTIYPWQDIVKIYATLSGHKLYHTTYQNAINNYVHTVYDTDMLKGFKYGDELPAEYMENINKMVEQGQKATDVILQKAGLIEEEIVEETTE